MSTSAIAVRVPGGLGAPIGGGGQDPRKPGGEAPGRAHEKEKTGLTAEQKAERKAAKVRRRREQKAKAEARPKSDVAVSSARASSKSRDVKDEDNSDIIFISSHKRVNKSLFLF